MAGQNGEEEQLFTRNTKVPNTSQWGKSLIEEISSAFERASVKMKNIHEMIMSVNKEITETLNTVKTEVLSTTARIERTADEALKQANKCADDVLNLKRQLQNTQRDCYNLKEENRSIREQSLRQELYSRRDNLIVNGVLDRQQETPEQCKLALHTFFQQQLNFSQQSARNIRFVRCHRMGKYMEGKARPIIMRFYNFDERQSVWFSCNKLKGKPYNMSEDYPRDIVFRRRYLYPIFKLAKDSGEYQSVYLKLDELYINNQRYTVNNLHLLPKKLNPHTLSYKTDEHTYVTGGLYSEYNKLSNWAPCKFDFRGHEYDTLEHGWQHQKAMQAEQHSAAFKIMCAPDARTAKEQGRTVMMTNQQRQRWEAGRKELMTNMLKAKVEQNDDVRAALLATGNKRLGETGTHDPYYTIGLKLTHPDVLNHRGWTTGNLMGIAMETVRRDL